MPIFCRGFSSNPYLCRDSYPRSRVIKRSVVHNVTRRYFVGFAADEDKSFQLFTYLGAAHSGRAHSQINFATVYLVHKAFMIFDIFLFSRCGSVSAVGWFIYLRHVTEDRPCAVYRARMTGQLIREISIAALLSNSLSLAEKHRVLLASMKNAMQFLNQFHFRCVLIEI